MTNSRRPPGTGPERARGRRQPPHQHPGRVDLGRADAPRVRPRCPRLSPLWRPAAGHRHRAGPGRCADHPRPRRSRALPLRRLAPPHPPLPRSGRLAAGWCQTLEGSLSHPSARSLTANPRRRRMARGQRGIARPALAVDPSRRAVPGAGSRFAGEAGPGRTPAAPAEVALIVPMRTRNDSPAACPTRWRLLWKCGSTDPRPKRLSSRSTHQFSPARRSLTL